METLTITEEMEKIEIITDLFHACSLEQLKEIQKCFIPGNEVSKAISLKSHGRK